MKPSKRSSSVRVTAVALLIAVALLVCLPARAAEPKTSTAASPRQWSVQVIKVDPAGIELAEAFQVAIYENLLDELKKTKRFQQVLRDGSRKAADVPDLLILKTTVEKYAPGSETKRAVTTLAGATKLIVHSQLCTRDGKVILDRSIDGNVRFLGGNLRATHNLAHHVAEAIKNAPLPEGPETTP
jgi:hypothetical protein